MSLKKAKRQMLIGAIALAGPSGSGKTLGALLLAYGMMKEKYPDISEDAVWDKIGLLDTEHERSLIYEGMVHQGVKIGQFWHYDMKAPYSIERGSAAFDKMKSSGVEVIVVDSTTHFWDGEGGILDYQQQLGGRFQDWNSANKEAYAPMVDLFTGTKHKIHVINTMRTKQEHAMQPDDVGKMQVVKLGMKPIQRDTFEYEFHIVFNIGMDHKFQTSKDNSGLFEGKNEVLTPKHGALIQQWLGEGKDIFAEREALAKKQEEERMALAGTIRQLEKDYDLGVYVTSMENHPAIKNPVEYMSMNTLKQLYAAMQQKIQVLEENKAKTEEKAKADTSKKAAATKTQTKTQTKGDN